MIACPECKGTGKSGMVIAHASRVDGSPPMIDDEARSLAEHVSKCTLCVGKGEVREEQLLWRQLGNQWRQARIILGIGLREWAESRGSLPSDYSKMEQGLIEPIQDERCLSPVVGLICEHQLGYWKWVCPKPSNTMP